MVERMGPKIGEQPCTCRSRISGESGFKSESSWLADACRKSKTAPGDDPVRLPGEAGLARRRQALKDGVELFPGIKKMLDEWADKLGVQSLSSLN